MGDSSNTSSPHTQQDKEIDRLKAELAAANKMVEMKNTECNRARHDLEVACKEIEQLRAESAAANKRADSKNAELQECNRARHDLEVAHKEMEAQLAQARNEVHDVLATHGRLELAHKEMESQLAQARKRIEYFESHVEYSWKVSHSDIHLVKEIGRGGYGTVHTGQLKVAVKQLHHLIMSPEMVRLMNREIDIMSKLRHPNLLFFIAAVFDDPSGNPLIISELMERSLRDAYEKRLLTTEREKLAIMRDAAAGLNYLHCLPDPIIHRDVSSANVLLVSKGPGQWATKISDFGSAKLAKRAITTGPGARIYSAPEALQTVTSRGRLPQTMKMDVFSFGILLCEVMTNRLPIETEFQFMLEHIKKMSPPVHQLICQCIEDSYLKRPTMSAVIDALNECIAPHHHTPVP